MKKHKAVFLDRDGTINVYKPDYLWKIEDFLWIPEAKEGLRILSKTDYKIVIVSNQSGVGRGYYTKEDVERLHDWMLEECKKEGIRIDAIYYCPHHPDEGCLCRKPKPGMIHRAAEELVIDLKKSWMIGDNPKDIEAGHAAGLKTIQVENRELKAPDSPDPPVGGEDENPSVPTKEGTQEPHKSVKHLKDAVTHITRIKKL
ncbi:MAG: D-glycero-beta-D-manno-heptose 1,7-bisphosphate 7-phosphatase [bacterium]|nr:D-glycero-beta-D-manno-heptose 1,7-bisphosphate 7-phosphatase [bacterium]